MKNLLNIYINTTNGSPFLIPAVMGWVAWLLVFNKTIMKFIEYLYENGYKTENHYVFEKSTEDLSIKACVWSTSKLEAGGVRLTNKRFNELNLKPGDGSWLEFEEHFSEDEPAIQHLIHLENKYSFPKITNNKKVVNLCICKYEFMGVFCSNYKTDKIQVNEVGEIKKEALTDGWENYWWEINGVQSGNEYWNSGVVSNIWTKEELLELEKTQEIFNDEVVVKLNGFRCPISQYRRLLDGFLNEYIFVVHHIDNKQFIYKKIKPLFS